MRAIALVLVLAAALAAQQSSIEGVVVNQTTGQPIAGVHIRFFNAVVLESAKESYGALTDASGRFSLETMSAGTYTVECEGAGFLQVPGNAGYARSTQITLRTGERLTGQKLMMLPLLPITGLVTNRYGDPAVGMRVRATEQIPSAQFGGPPFSEKSTDDRGQFRLFVTPGKHYVLVDLQGYLGPLGRAETRTDGTADLVYATTYYPDSPDAAGARTVEVAPGVPVDAIEIHLRNGGVRRSLSVSGVVTGAPAGCQTTVAYQYGETPGKFSIGNSGGRVDSSGRFSFDNLAPGYVSLMAQCLSATESLQSDVVDLHLEASGANDVKLALTPGGAITGSLEIAGGRLSPEATSRVTVRYAPAGPGLLGSMALPVAVRQDGAFRITGIAPGRGSLDIQGLPANAYVKALALNGAPIIDGILDFSRGARDAKLKITVGLNGAGISGEVRNTDGSPLSDSRVLVFLAPEPNQMQPLGRFGAPVIDGRYDFKGLPPGRYKLYVADPTRPSPRGNADDLRKALLAAATTVEVAEGARTTWNLRYAEDPDALPKQ